MRESDLELHNLRKFAAIDGHFSYTPSVSFLLTLALHALARLLILDSNHLTIAVCSTEYESN